MARRRVRLDFGVGQSRFYVFKFALKLNTSIGKLKFLKGANSFAEGDLSFEVVIYFSSE